MHPYLHAIMHTLDPRAYQPDPLYSVLKGPAQGIAHGYLDLLHAGAYRPPQPQPGAYPLTNDARTQLLMHLLTQQAGQPYQGFPRG